MAACSWLVVILLAICTTTSSLIMRVSVAGGISTILLGRLGRTCRAPPAALEGGCGAGCGGVLIAPGTLLTTGGVTSAAS